MRAITILFALFLLFAATGHAQKTELSALSQISVLTAGSGNELYSSFGHSAIRVQDRAVGIDVVYNYGMFDFTTPNFYSKFTRGQLDYTLARQPFSYFLLGYEEEKRWVKEQTLDLDLAQRNELFQFLETNYLPENRDYKYEFFYNNCATKIWDVLRDVYGDDLVFDENYVTENYTHRELIRQKVPINSWSGFGIDLALGSVIDDKATPKEYMFLPEYIMKQLAQAELNANPLASKTQDVLDFEKVDNHPPFLLSPAFWLCIFLITVLILTYLDFKYNVRRRWLDFILFFVSGAAGSLIIFLWFFTEHTATAGNLNVLWAFPPNLIIAFIVAQKRGPNWVAKYSLFLLALLIMTILLWLTGIQIFSPLMLLVWSAFGTRYFFLFWSYQKPKLA